MKTHRAYSLFEVKAFDEDSRELEGIATTPTTDRMGDIVEPEGATFKLPLPLLWQHDAGQPIGHVISAKVSPQGITVRAKFAKLDEPGPLKDRLDAAWQSVKYGLVRGFSIGFRALESARIKDTWSEHFLKWDWLELSCVTIPANAEATITSVKSADQLLRRAASGAGAHRVVRLEDTPASRVSPLQTSKGTETMKKTIAEQIAALEAKRAADVARREELQAKAIDEGRSKDAAEKEEFDNLTAEIATIDAELKDLRTMEAQRVSAAAEVRAAAGTDPSLANAARAVAGHGFISVKPNVEKGIAFTRYVKAMVNSMFNPQLAMMYAQSQRGWKDQTPHVIEALRVKANVAANTTTETGGGAELVYNQNLAGEFIDLVRPLTIIGRIPGFRRVPFNVRVGALTSGSTAYWVGQGKPIPVSRIGTSEVTLGEAKAAGLVVLPKELIRSSDPSAEMLVRDDLVRTNVEFLDENFIAPDYAAVANVNPASITNGVVPTAATGTALANLRTDVQTLMAAFINNEVPLTGLVWVMHPKIALAISLMQNALGQQEFPEMTLTGGVFFGLPAIASEKAKQVGSPVTGEGQLMVLLNAAEIMLADDGQVDVEASGEASLQMLDNPTTDVTTPTATSLVSMWQTDSVALRAIRHINWAKRRANIVQYIKDAAYVG